MRRSDDEINLRVLKALRRVIRAIDIHSREINGRFHVTVPQMICLGALREAGASTMTELAAAVELGASTINGIVDRLEAKGLVRRVRGQKDRRKVALELTDAGRRTFDTAPPLIQERFTERLSHLTDRRRRELARALEQVVDLMGAAGLDAAPHLVPHAVLGSKGVEDHEPEPKTTRHR